MFNFRKYKQKIEQQAQEIEQQAREIEQQAQEIVRQDQNAGRLQEELDRYKHAFETTATDRDRLQRLIEGDAPAGDSGAGGNAEPVVDDLVASYGSLWGSVANVFEAIQGGSPVDQSVFEQIVTYGGFSQFTMYQSPEFLDQLMDWQIEMLRKIDLEVDDLPKHFCEAEVMPDHALRLRHGRRVSVDFLRLLSYTHVIRQQLDNAGKKSPRLILEIGSGFGGLARLLKLTYPTATICLVDIPACLRVAHHYIKESLPEARIHWCDGAVDDVAAEGVDFYLVPADQAHHIQDQNIDLAMNVWSFGEMPNQQIQKWFDFIQKNNETAHLFLINHFMATVPLHASVLKQQSDHYDWLRRMDHAWHIRAFEIDPVFECPPSVTHKHRGILIFADRLTSATAIETDRHAAAKAAGAVHAYDWASGSLPWVEPDGCDPAQARSNFLTRSPEPITADTPLVLDQFARMLGLWRPDNDQSMNGSFFRLWNDLRLNGSVESLRLLRIWFRLHWRPATLENDGRPSEAIFREELHFGLDEQGHWIEDPCLLFPDWLNNRLYSLKMTVENHGGETDTAEAHQ